MEQPIILCGLGRVGWRVLEYLQAAGLPVVVVDTICHPDDPRLQNVRIVKGDCRRREVLEMAGAGNARAVLILTSDDLLNISTALVVRTLNHQVRIVLRMFNQNLLTRLGKAVNNIFALSASALAAPILAVAALTGQGMGTFRVEGLALAGRPGTASRAGQAQPQNQEPGDNGRPINPVAAGKKAQTTVARRQVAEVAITPTSPLRGQSVTDAATFHDAVVIAHFPANGPPRYLIEVDQTARLELGDRLVLCADPHSLAPLLIRTEHGEIARVRWASWLRRLGRMIWRTLMEVDLALKITGAVMVAVILISTLIFAVAIPDDGLAGALYRTVTLMASRADLTMTAKHDASLKVFSAFLRVFGVALLAMFTAIITNSLLRLQLRGALEVRRIPESGHVIVCGLGNVGFRVIEELIGMGERVVVLELSRDGRFVSTARRLGAAVIQGDATVREVLRQAHTATARAVVAVTSNDLINLEVALLVRELNEQQRVVMRLSDPNLANMLREATSVDLALSVADLAAPAFVAALFGDRVLNVFLVGDRLLAVVDMLITANDTHLVDQTVRALAVDYRVLPVLVLRPDGTPERNTLTGRLSAGGRLVGVLELANLERFARRQPVPREFAVDVTGFTMPARGWVTLLLRTQRGLSQEEAENALNQLPVLAGTNLTRGQAEDLLAMLYRERVNGQLRRLKTEDSPTQ
jgi:Trk K+ transport system NAD-binding subunit